MAQVKVYSKSKKQTPRFKEPSDREMDQRRANTAFREFGTQLQRLESWAADLIRYSKMGVPIRNQDMVLASLRECSSVFNRAIKVLGHETKTHLH
jgi:hypothetical protein